jgi:hypothetical protein
VIGLDTDELDDLTTYISVLREHPDRLTAAMLDPRLASAGSRHSRTERHTVSHLLEAVTNFGPVLECMLYLDRIQTVRLLARALTDWDQRLRPWTGLPDMYAPLVALASIVLASPAPAPIVSDLLTEHPASGWLLVQAMPWRDPHRLRGVLDDLDAEHPAALDILVEMLVDMRDGRRQLRLCEKLVTGTKDSADPILRRIIAGHSAQIRDILRYSEQHAPRFTERTRALLQEHDTHTRVGTLRMLRTPYRVPEPPPETVFIIPTPVSATSRRSAADHPDHGHPTSVA